MGMRVEFVQEAAEDLITAASFKLLMRALLVLGASRQELAGAIR